MIGGMTNLIGLCLVAFLENSLDGSYPTKETRYVLPKLIMPLGMIQF
jgi:hypothetical protein